jgi:CelD/BcsL family acetyltransferase involved in cellulose biosynthesis
MTRFMTDTSSTATDHANADFSITVAGSFEDLEPWADQWNELALTMPQRLAVLSHAWMSAYFRHRVAKDEQWFCVLAHADDKLLGVLPLIVRRRKVLSVSVCVLATPFDWHTISADCAVRQGQEAAVIPAMIHTAFEHVPQARWLEFKRLPESSPTLMHAAAVPRASVLAENDAPGSVFPTQGDFDAYFASLGGNARKNLRRWTNRLQREFTVEPQLRIVSHNWQTDFERLLDLEAAGWKGERGSAIRRSAKLVDFYRDLAGRLADKGWLELCCLECGSQLLAAMLCIRFGCSITVMKTCYDEQYRRHSPGNVALFQAIRRAFGIQSVDKVDAMTRADFHLHWNPDSCEYYHLYVYSSGWRSTLIGRWPRVIRDWGRKQKWLRRLLKR